MKRILLMVFRNLFFVPYGWFKLCWYASHAERYSEEQRYQLLKYVDNRAVKGGNLVIDGHGMENIPKEMGLFSFPIIRDYLMYLQSYRCVRYLSR